MKRLASEPDNCLEPNLPRCFLGAKVMLVEMEEEWNDDCSYREHLQGAGHIPRINSSESHNPMGLCVAIIPMLWGGVGGRDPGPARHSDQVDTWSRELSLGTQLPLCWKWMHNQQYKRLNYFREKSSGALAQIQPMARQQMQLCPVLFPGRPGGYANLS
jgi:hypothetical protein